MNIYLPQYFFLELHNNVFKVGHFLANRDTVQLGVGTRECDTY